MAGKARAEKAKDEKADEQPQNASVHNDDLEGDPFADKRNDQGQLSPEDGMTPDPLVDEAKAEASKDPYAPQK